MHSSFWTYLKRAMTIALIVGCLLYTSTRILLQNGFKARNISGGMLSLAHNYLLDTHKEGD